MTDGTNKTGGLAVKVLGTGSAHDWGSIEYLRSPEVILLTPGESVARMVKLEGVNLSAGKARVDLSIRIHGTDDLDDPKMRTYSCEATPDSVSADVDSASRHGGQLSVEQSVTRAPL